MGADDYIDRYALVTDTPESIKSINVTNIYRDFVGRGKKSTMTEAEAYDASEKWYGDRNAIRDGVRALRRERIEMLRHMGKTAENTQAAMDCYPYEALFRIAY